MTKIGILFAMSVMAFGCGSDSNSSTGADPTLELGQLTSGEITQECTFVVSAFPSKTATCSDGSTATVNGQSESQCEAMLNAVPATCTVTVGTSEDCLAALEADPCNGLNDASCTALFDASCM